MRFRAAFRVCQSRNRAPILLQPQASRSFSQLPLNTERFLFLTSLFIFYYYYHFDLTNTQRYRNFSSSWILWIFLGLLLELHLTLMAWFFVVVFPLEALPKLWEDCMEILVLHSSVCVRDWIMNFSIQLPFVWLLGKLSGGGKENRIHDVFIVYCCFCFGKFEIHLNYTEIVVKWRVWKSIRFR